MKAENLVDMAAIALALSVGSAVAEQHSQDMVNVVIGTVVRIPFATQSNVRSQHAAGHERATMIRPARLQKTERILGPAFDRRPDRR